VGVQDFDAARRERQREYEAVPLVMGDETFTLPKVIPAGLVVELARRTIDLEGRPVEELTPRERTEATLASYDFFIAVVGEAQADRMRAVLTNTEDPIGLDTIDEIVQWLALLYVGRPTVRSSDSAGGPRTNGQDSKPGSSEPEDLASRT
jgi:hypothetical protein